MKKTKRKGMGRFFVKTRVSPSAREIAGQARNEGVVSLDVLNVFLCQGCPNHLYHDRTIDWNSAFGRQPIPESASWVA